MLRKISFLSSVVTSAVMLSQGLFIAPVMALDEFDEDPFLADFPTVLSVSRLAQTTNELPASVTVIDREMIEASGAIEIADLFRLVPGFQVGHYHHFEGEKTIVTYHGISDQFSRRMQVLIDGRSVYLPSTGGVMWNDLPITLHEIERIEVTRGPNGVSYGMNSFQGVINIITQSPDEIGDTKVYSLIGTNELTNLTLKTSGQSESFKYKFSAAYERDSGFDEINDDSESLRINSRGDYQIGVNDSISIGLGGVVGTRQAGFVYDPSAPAGYDGYVATYFSLRDQQLSSSYQQLNYNHIISSDDEINVQLYHSVRTGKDQYETEKPSVILDAYYGAGSGDPYVALPPIPVNIVLFDDQTDLEITHQLRLSKNIRAVWGGELRIDRFRGYDYVNTSDTFVNRSQRLFISTEWQPSSRWVVNFGDMFEKTDYIASNHSPRIAVSRLFKDHYVRAVRSKAWRSPAFLENEFDYTITIGPVVSPQLIGSTDLNAEKIVSSELAFGGKFTKNSLNYELRMFREEMSDLIETPKAPTVISNNGSSDVRGTELQIKWRPHEDTLVHMGYSHINASGIFGSLNIADLIPEDTFNILVSQKLNQHSRVGINYSQVGEMSFETADTDLDGYAILNIKYDRDLKILNRRSTLSLIGRDLMESYKDYNASHFTITPQYYIGLDIEI
ncbi:MAG: TonB-dependent receptor plug domain-containing protein [Gammaproteobacteria bacterium]|nr:TonB-dependent receptor plug domain-containing protein [Gammaproteobacteria bacterium]